MVELDDDSECTDLLLHSRSLYGEEMFIKRCLLGLVACSLFQVASITILHAQTRSGRSAENFAQDSDEGKFSSLDESLDAIDGDPTALIGEDADAVTDSFDSLEGRALLAQSDLGAVQVAPMPVEDQVPFSRPTPFQITPETAEAGNSQNFFTGNQPVQDLSALLPGKFTNTKYKWYGMVRVDAIFDFNPIGATDSFATSSIPVPQGRGQNVSLTPRYTRLGFDTETPWEAMDWKIKTRLEVDFFNGNQSGAFGSFPLRLRFAWVDFGPFLIGQSASLFMDYDAFPNVVDYQGPPGMVLMRQPIAAVRFPLGEKFKISAGMEQPYSDIQWFEGGGWVVNPGTGNITTPGVGRNIQDMPDFTGNLRYTGDYGHVQLAGIARKLTFQPATAASDSVFGYGGNLTGTWHPWAQWEGCPTSDAKTPMQKSRFLGQYAAGRGIARYIQELNGFGLDATYDPTNGFRAISSQGWFVAYEQWWADNWASNFTLGGTARSSLTGTLPDNTLKEATYYSANIIWFPVERMGVGLEYLTGSRENKDGESGTAHRLQAGLQYKF